MSKKKFYIFRHGQTFATKNKTGYGWQILTAPLLPEARPSLERMAEYLKEVKTDLNVTSPIRRCRQTVQIIESKTGKSFVRDMRLTEYLLETFTFFTRRIRGFLDAMENSPYQSISVCTHGAVIAALKGYLLSGDFSRGDLFTYPDPGQLLIIEDNQIQTIDFN